MKLTNVFDELGIEYETEGKFCREGWIQVQCPYCGGGSNPNKPYMGISETSHGVSCWNCGRHKLVDTLHKLSGESYQVIRDLIGYLEWEAYEDKPGISRKIVEYPKNTGDLLIAHINYLKHRGFNPEELLRLWDIRGIGIAASLQWRIFIPIYYQGKVVSWTTRLIVDDQEPRYVSAPPSFEVMNHKHLLYGHDYVRHSMVVHEGSFDVWATGPGAVATMGLQVTNQQLAKIAEVPLRCICFDNESEAQERAKKLCERLSVYPGRTINIVLDSANDAAEAIKTKAGRKEIATIRKLYLE